jgi:hypothetical protein
MTSVIHGLLGQKRATGMTVCNFVGMRRKKECASNLMADE